MFTGIIQSIGEVAAIEPKGDDARVRIFTNELDLADVQLGDSIAVNGVCLTAVELPGDGFWADVSAETLSCTTFKSLTVGTKANLEKALTPTTRIGGHLVSGHVDGIGKIVERYDDGRSVRFHVQTPDEMAKYIAEKGSVCVDGISLTVNAVNGAIFELNIVPHTLQETTMSQFKTGTEVNLEVDIIARYLERLILGDKAADVKTSGISMDMLAEHGFLK
ncbi:MAG: riboflavin synthase [Gammaproteobacteria bacterium]|nr:MAG: riboflavin synthase [Gammaproteobacteria bacterium]